MFKLIPSIATLSILLLTCGAPTLAQENSEPEIAPFVVPAGGFEEINIALEALSNELLLSLPSSGTYVIKSINDTTSGVPEDFLTQLSSSLFSSLMAASGFEINLIDQSQLNSAWANAVEFNGANFEDLVKNSTFEAIILINSRATANGIELSLQAIGATVNNSGQIIASSKVISVPIDWNSLSSVNISGVNDDIAAIREQLENLKSIDSPVPSPKNWVEFYSNSQKYAEKRDIVASINSLEKALLRLPDFFDPAFDFAATVRSKFGVVGAQKYFTTRLSGKIKPEHESVVRLALGINEATVGDIGSSFDANPVLAAVWFWSEGQTLLARRDRDFSKSMQGNSIYTSYDLDFYLLKAIRAIVSADMNGSLSNNFFDISLEESIVRMTALLGVEEKINRVEYGISKVTHKFGTGDAGFEYTETGGWKEQSTLINLRPLSIMGQPWNSLDWEKSQDPIFSSLINATGVCGLDFCGLDLIVNGTFTSPFCRNEPTDDDYEALLASIDANTAEITMADFEVNQFEVENLATASNSVSAARALEDAGSLYTFDSPYIPPRYADLCILADGIAGYSDIKLTQDREFEVFGPSDLVITDNIDVTKPILLTFSTGWGNEDPVDLTVDITKDGTSIYNSGFPLEVIRYQDHEATGSQFVKGWLYVPSWIESALFTEDLSSISYTDMLGRHKVVNNIFIKNGDLASTGNQTLSFDRLNNFSSRWRNYFSDSDYEKKLASYESPSKKFENLVFRNTNDHNVGGLTDISQTALADFSSLGSCVNVADSVFYPTNINDYVNLRLDPTTNGLIIKKIYKGEKLEWKDKSVYTGVDSSLRNQCYNLCKSEAETGAINKANLLTCIDENSLWLKLRSSDGLEGYISTKFLGVESSD